ncbi:sugar phosphate isomerase/epimerase family protein [Mucilaginibacter gotjawali]|uniref:Sugar phosphate isomerase/epimerase n=1 Tax=Mucilaginibacter gotjawali TaxID=1550579 RepID=A0A839SNQ2_9SPHI|nr:sugar phosphate isomerase/epimerase [Mucilaginibacter gotjawali]MBB3058958.1 sugar phosphate isomerase/epimerase [Mucilaginibacter gotjawali]
MTNRRSFIKNTGLLALSLPLLKSNLLASSTQKKLPAIGIQLYMVKEDMAKDPAGTLAQLGKMGYTQIESYGGDKGIFWGMTNKEFSKLANDNGLTLISSHFAGNEEDFEKTAALAAEIGMKYLIYPWKGPQKDIDAFKRIAAEFNDYGAICQKNGIKFAYHPHDYPYKPVNGQLPIDVLLANTDKEFVDFQMDYYYTVTEGQDPETYIKKYRPRFRLCHLRDVLKERLPAGSEDESACDLGQGIINYPHLLSTALDNGMEYFFVEQSRFYHETPLQSARVNLDYLKNLKLV